MRRHQRLRPREIKLYVGRVLHVACNESQEGQEVNLWDLTCDEFDISPWDGFIGTQNQGLFVEPKRHDEGHEVVTFFDGFEQAFGGYVNIEVERVECRCFVQTVQK